MYCKTLWTVQHYRTISEISEKHFKPPNPTPFSGGPPPHLWGWKGVVVVPPSGTTTSPPLPAHTAPTDADVVNIGRKAAHRKADLDLVAEHKCDLSRLK